jgi:voltage-dependent potassium channel beta subunit
MASKMQYRRLGRSGLQVSVLSFGSWVTFDNQLGDAMALECMQAAYDAGCNFFDNAEAYAGGGSEGQMGRVIRELGWKRESYVVSTKFFWGLNGNMRNMRNTLNRKYLAQAIDGSLQRMQLDFIDLVYCHRADPNTPLEETVWAMSDMITQGKALYWGTSEWSADEIRAAWEIADRRNLHKPVMEQPQYNLLHRKRVDQEYRRLYEDIGLGLTTWSPLASGLLSGKYRKGIPPGSRGAVESYAFLREGLTDPDKNAIVDRLEAVARELDATLAQLALAWCLANPNVSSVITGATRVDQVTENMKSLAITPKLSADVLARINEIVGARFD